MIDYSPSYPDEVSGEQSKSPRNLSCLEMFLDDFTPGQLMEMEALLVVCFLSFSWISDCDDYSNRMFCYSHVDIRCEYATSIIKLTDVHTEIFDSQYLSYNKSLMGRHSKFLFQNHDFVSHMQSVSDRVLFYKESWRAIRPYVP